MDIWSGIVIAVFAAMFSSWLTMVRFRIERWWEKKAEAYIELVEALHQMNLMPSEQLAAASENRHELSDEEETELWKTFEVARRTVWRIADGTDFIISSEVLAVIQGMNNEIGEAEQQVNWEQSLHETKSAIDCCLKKIKSIGADELGIKKGSGWKSWIPVKISNFFREFKTISKLLEQEK